MEKDVEFMIRKMEGSNETQLLMRTSAAKAIAFIATAICDLGEHIREEDGEEAYIRYLDLVGNTLSAKNLWEIMNGAEKGLLAKLVDKIFK